MDKNNNTVHFGGRSYEVPDAPKKSRRILNVLAVAAGTAAVIAGGVFGLNYLHEHGGLKEGGIDTGNDAGYHDDTAEPAITSNALAAAEAAAEELPDIREAYGKPIQFSDAVVTLKSAGSDGESLYAVFDVKYTGTDRENFAPEYVMLKGLEADPVHDYNFTNYFEDTEYGYICSYNKVIRMEEGRKYALDISYLSSGAPEDEETYTQTYSFSYEPKETTISVRFADDDLGDFEFEYYIDGEYQNKNTVTKDLSGQQKLEWTVKGSGILTYRVDVRSVSNQQSAALFECTVDFTKDEPTKDFGETFNPKVFRKLSEMPAVGDWTKPADNINISDTIEFSDCTVNVSGIERYGNTVKLTLDAYAKESCDLTTDLFNICETGDREENRIPKGIFFERDERDPGHLQYIFVLQPYFPDGTERTYMLKKYDYTINDSDEAAYFTMKGADTPDPYIRDLDTVGTGLAGTKIPIRRIEITPHTISFDMVGSPSFEENFSIKFKDGRIYTYNKEALVRNGRIWEDRNGDMVCAVAPDFARLADDGDYFEEKVSDDLRYFLIAEKPIFNVNEIESVNILGAEIPITAEEKQPATDINAKDITDASDDIIEFEGLTATIKNVDFDGIFLRCTTRPPDITENRRVIRLRS